MKKSIRCGITSIEKNCKGMSKMKDKKDKKQLFVKIMAGVLAGIFIIVSAGTVIYYLFA